jgi:hypothetical protein
VTIRVEEVVLNCGTLGLVGFTLSVGPVGLTEGVRFTTPENPLMLVRVIVDVAVPPAPTWEDVGLADIPKSQATYVLACAEPG